MAPDHWPNELRERIWSNVVLLVPALDSLDRIIWITWDRFYRRRLDRAPSNWEGDPWEPVGFRQEVEATMLQAPWFDSIDLLEFWLTSEELPDLKPLERTCNAVLESEQAAWRFVDGRLQQITAPAEIEAIEQALENPFDQVREHLHTALEHLGRRPEPDTRNAMKEAITAVEAAAKALEKSDSATFTKAVHVLDAGREGVSIAGSYRVRVENNSRSACRFEGRREGPARLFRESGDQRSARSRLFDVSRKAPCLSPGKHEESRTYSRDRRAMHEESRKDFRNRRAMHEESRKDFRDRRAMHEESRKDFRNRRAMHEESRGELVDL